MSIKFVCSKCGKVYNVSDKLAGKNGTCKVEGCGQRFTVPCLDTSTASPNTSQLKPKPKKSNWYKKYKRFAPIIAIIPIILFGGVLYLFSSTKAEAARLKNEISVLAEKAKKQFDKKQFDESITTNKEIIKIARNIGFFTKVIIGDEEFISELEHSEKFIKKTIQTKEQIAIENKRIADAEKARLQKEQEERERLAEIERQKQLEIKMKQKQIESQTKNITAAIELAAKESNLEDAVKMLKEAVQKNPEAKNLAAVNDYIVQRRKEEKEESDKEWKKIVDSAKRLKKEPNDKIGFDLSKKLKVWDGNEFTKRKETKTNPLIFCGRFITSPIDKEYAYKNTLLLEDYLKIIDVKYDFENKALSIVLRISLYTLSLDSKSNAHILMVLTSPLNETKAEEIHQKFKNNKLVIDMIFQIKDYTVQKDNFSFGTKIVESKTYDITDYEVIDFAFID